MEQKPLNWVAILVGWAVKAFAGGAIVMILTTVLFASSAASNMTKMMAQMSKMPKGTKASPQQIQEMAHQLQQSLFSPSLIITTLIIGTIFLILGGFTAGKMAGHAEVKHAMIVGIISFVLAIFTSLPSFFVAASGFGPPIISVVMPILLSIPMAMLGGMLAEMTRGTTRQGRDLLASDAPSAFDPIPRI